MTLSCKWSLDLDLDADAPSLLIPSRMSSKEDILDLLLVPVNKTKIAVKQLLVWTTQHTDKAKEQ